MWNENLLLYGACSNCRPILDKSSVNNDEFTLRNERCLIYTFSNKKIEIKNDGLEIRVFDIEDNIEEDEPLVTLSLRE
jgi:hypothetical protein